MTHPQPRAGVRGARFLPARQNRRYRPASRRELSTSRDNQNRRANPDDVDQAVHRCDSFAGWPEAADASGSLHDQQKRDL